MHDEIIDFACQNKKSRHDPQYVGYDEYTNNKNQYATNKKKQTPSITKTEKKRRAEIILINPLSPELVQQQTDDYQVKKMENINYDIPVPPSSIPRLENFDSDIYDEYQNNNVIGKNKNNNTLSRDNVAHDNINHQVQSHDTNLLQSHDTDIACLSHCFHIGIIRG